MRLTCGHTAPAPTFTASQLFHWTAAPLLLTCPEGDGLVDVDYGPDQIQATDQPDPWEVGV